MCSDHHAGTAWAPMARTRAVVISDQRFDVHMLSVVAADEQFHSCSTRAARHR